MRWWLAIALVVGCGKSNKGGGGSGSGSAAPLPAGDAAVAAVAPVPSGPVLPPEARCGGHWTGTLDWFEKQCKDAALFAPFPDIDLTIKASATGWDAAVTKPAGLRLKTVSVTWENDAETKDCYAKLYFELPNHDSLDLDLHHDKDHTDGYAHFGHIISANESCNGQAAVRDGKLVVDGGALPAPPPEVLRAVGDYTVDITWKKAPKCPEKEKVPPPPGPKLTFKIADDRDHGDKLALHGLLINGEEPAGEVNVFERGTKLNAHSGGVIDLAEGGQASDETHLEIVLAGDAVTGTVAWEVAWPDGQTVCSANGTFQGTRTGLPVKAPSTQQIVDAFQAAVRDDGKPAAPPRLVLAPQATLGDPTGDYRKTAGLAATIVGTPTVSLSADGTAAWVTADLASAAGKPADLHASVLLAGPPWHPVFVHVGASMTGAGAAPAKLERRVEPGAEMVAKKFEDKLGDALAFSWTVGTHDDSVMFGSEQRERFAGANVVRGTLQKWNLALALRDGLYAGVLPGGTVAWVAANVDARNVKQPKQSPTPYRLTAIYERAGDEWEITVLHFSSVAK